MTNALRKEARSTQSCCAVIEEAADQARERRLNRTKKQPWIVLKLMVFFTAALMAYAAYVYLGRLCADMIIRKPGAGGSRVTGIVLTIVFSILWLWMVWAYAKVVFTPPGYAKDHVPQSDRPMFPEPPPAGHHDSYSQDGSEHQLTPLSAPYRGPTSDEQNTPHTGRDVSSAAAQGEHSFVAEPTERGANAGVLDALPRPPPLRVADSKIPLPSDRKLAKSKKPKDLKEPKVYVARRPPTTPVLHPAHRYCQVDSLVKPYRTHHCRNCGTCVLKYDHHCPWIGQCVGARNQKFFLNFCQAASVATLYMFITLLVFTIRRIDSSDGDIDPQLIVIIALSAVFALFTISLQISHVFLISNGQTTVESMQMRNQKDRESDALDRAFGNCGIRQKQRMRHVWDEEWGRLDKEGNLWWLGGTKENWVDVMGHNPLGWFLPIGRSMNDGLRYPVNPRFDEEGRWKRRVDWPKELQ